MLVQLAHYPGVPRSASHRVSWRWMISRRTASLFGRSETENVPAFALPTSRKDHGVRATRTTQLAQRKGSPGQELDVSTSESVQDGWTPRGYDANRCCEDVVHFSSEASIFETFPNRRCSRDTLRLAQARCGCLEDELLARRKLRLKVTAGLVPAAEKSAGHTASGTQH